MGGGRNCHSQLELYEMIMPQISVAQHSVCIINNIEVYM
jgi:hypothetical protein